ISAILFAALLTWTQSLGLMAANCAPCATKSCCRNRQVAACCSKSTAPESVPAAPARTASQDQSQLLLVALNSFVPPPAPGIAEFSFPQPQPAMAAAALPLYQRNCSFLI